MILYSKYKIVTYVTMPLRKICYRYHEAWSIVDFSCAFNTYGSFISKTGMLFRKESFFVLFLLGHGYSWAQYLNGDRGRQSASVE